MSDEDTLSPKSLMEKELHQGGDALVLSFAEILSLQSSLPDEPPISPRQQSFVDIPRVTLADVHRPATDSGTPVVQQRAPLKSDDGTGPDVALTGPFRHDGHLTDPVEGAMKGTDCSHAALSRIENPDDLVLTYGGRIGGLEAPKLCAILRTLLRVLRLKPPTDKSLFHGFFRSLLPGILQWSGSQAQDLINTLRGANLLKYPHVADFQSNVEDRLTAKALLSAWDVSELLESYAGLGVKPGARMLDLLLHSMDVNHETFEPKARRVSLQSLEKLELFNLLPAAHEALTREPWKKEARKASLKQGTGSRMSSGSGSSSGFNSTTGQMSFPKLANPKLGPLAMDPGPFGPGGALLPQFTGAFNVDPRLAAAALQWHQQQQGSMYPNRFPTQPGAFPNPLMGGNPAQQAYNHSRFAQTHQAPSGGLYTAPLQSRTSNPILGLQPFNVPFGNAANYDIGYNLGMNAAQLGLSVQPPLSGYGDPYGSASGYVSGPNSQTGAYDPFLVAAQAAAAASAGPGAYMGPAGAQQGNIVPLRQTFDPSYLG